MWGCCCRVVAGCYGRLNPTVWPARLQGAGTASELSADEVAFINLLNQEISKFNTFFMDQEENCVIQLQVG
jgi:hypothetical protein